MACDAHAPPCGAPASNSRCNAAPHQPPQLAQLSNTARAGAEPAALPTPDGLLACLGAAVTVGAGRSTVAVPHGMPAGGRGAQVADQDADHQGRLDASRALLRAMNRWYADAAAGVGAEPTPCSPARSWSSAAAFSLDGPALVEEQHELALADISTHVSMDGSPEAWWGGSGAGDAALEAVEAALAAAEAAVAAAADGHDRSANAVRTEAAGDEGAAYSACAPQALGSPGAGVLEAAPGALQEAAGSSEQGGTALEAGEGKAVGGGQQAVGDTGGAAARHATDSTGVHAASTEVAPGQDPGPAAADEEQQEVLNHEVGHAPPVSADEGAEACALPQQLEAGAASALRGSQRRVAVAEAEAPTLPVGGEAVAAGGSTPGSPQPAASPAASEGATGHSVAEPALPQASSPSLPPLRQSQSPATSPRSPDRAECAGSGAADVEASESPACSGGPSPATAAGSSLLGTTPSSAAGSPPLPLVCTESPDAASPLAASPTLVLGGLQGAHDSSTRHDGGGNGGTPPRGGVRESIPLFVLQPGVLGRAAAGVAAAAASSDLLAGGPPPYEEYLLAPCVLPGGTCAGGRGGAGGCTQRRVGTQLEAVAEAESPDSLTAAASGSGGGVGNSCGASPASAQSRGSPAPRSSAGRTPGGLLGGGARSKQAARTAASGRVVPDSPKARTLTFTSTAPAAQCGGTPRIGGARPSDAAGPAAAATATAPRGALFASPITPSTSDDAQTPGGKAAAVAAAIALERAGGKAIGTPPSGCALTPSDDAGAGAERVEPQADSNGTPHLRTCSITAQPLSQHIAAAALPPA